jgi:hypothetical protein
VTETPASLHAMDWNSWTLHIEKSNASLLCHTSLGSAPLGGPERRRREFAQHFAAWQEKNNMQVDEEVALLATIEENSRLPAAEQRRYERLRRKCERRTLTERELAEYQWLLQQLEARNAKRVAALIALAQRRGTTLQGITAELGLPSVDNAE